MVLKRRFKAFYLIGEFENDVKMYGTQTRKDSSAPSLPFENDVKMYGTQTDGTANIAVAAFENDVKMYGTQTNLKMQNTQLRLRMM